MILARQSTARTVMVGPVLDASGVAVTDCVVADFEGSVNGGDPAALNGSATLTHRGVGFYSLALTATDLATVGSFEVTINDTVNACPMKELTVVEEAVYDSLFAASAVGYVANAPVSVAQWNGTAVKSPTTAGVPEVCLTDAVAHGGTLGSSTATLAMSRVSYASQSANTTAFTVTGNGTGDAAVFTGGSGATGDALRLISNSTNGSGLVTLATGASAAILTQGITGPGFSSQTGGTTATQFGTTTATITANITGNLSGSVGSVTGAVGSVTGNVGGNVTGSVGSVATGGIAAASFAAGAIDAAAIAANAIGASELAADAVAEIADAVWDEAISGHLTVGSTGEALNAAGSAGDPWTTSLPGAYTGSQAGKMLSDILTDTAEIGAAGAGLTNINLPNQTMDITGNITGNLSGSVGSVTGTVGGISGTTTTLDSLQTALNSAHGAGSWATATGFSTHSAADVWTSVTRTLTAGTNIALAKGVGVTGFTDLSAADVRTAVGLASANLDTQLTAIDDYLDTEVAAIKAKTDNLPAAPSAVGDIPTAVQNADALLGRNVAGGSSTGRTVSQALFVLRNKVAIVGTTMTVYSTDDTTASWTSTVTADAAADPITATDPA